MIAQLVSLFYNKKNKLNRIVPIQILHVIYLIFLEYNTALVKGTYLLHVYKSFVNVKIQNYKYKIIKLEPHYLG